MSIKNMINFIQNRFARKKRDVQALELQSLRQRLEQLESSVTLILQRLIQQNLTSDPSIIEPVSILNKIREPRVQGKRASQKATSTVYLLPKRAVGKTHSLSEKLELLPNSKEPTYH